ncbi:hypothetical protein [Flagellimonas marina]|uniref:Uncharacterized protein n=1 Tax=Flagellimonas marina TaxID=1775168 RepID=A0ABV8PIP0_9FLAO
MEKALERLKEIRSNYENRGEYSHEETLGELKPEINNMLHVYLPDDITIKEAEILSMLILEIIMNPHQFIR